MATLRRWFARGVALGLIATAVLALVGIMRSHPQDWPWTPLRLDRPIGAFTGRKLAALRGEGAHCRALLANAGVAVLPLPPRHEGVCGYADAVRFTAGAAGSVPLRPAGPALACPLAAALVLWQRDIVQPAAQRLFHSAVAHVDHLGSYNCRRLYGRTTGVWSEHAQAEAIDVAGFTLSDGTRIGVARDWRGGGRKAAFLHAVRDGGCRLFATVLSPDYNAAHHDHLHLDEAARGVWGGTACR